MVQDKTVAECAGNHRSYFERLNYYFGKMLTVRDFTDLQSYYNQKRWLLNRLGVGCGVLCGLNVRQPENSDNPLIVEKGFAIDEAGHEIWVCEDQSLDFKANLASVNESDTSQPSEYLVSIKYFECLTGKSPVPVDDCGVYKTDCVYDRTRESFKINISPWVQESESETPELKKDEEGCEMDCHAYLQTPTYLVNESCTQLTECVEIPLARIYFDKNGQMKIDNTSVKKSAFCNANLLELIQCLRDELWKADAAKRDRKRNVPLLAQTIRGVEYQDGRIISKELENAHPVRMTTDGKQIWITDRSQPRLFVLNQALQIVRGIADLPGTTWGIAFDGKRMWVTHQVSGTGESQQGIVTGIQVCNMDKSARVEISDLPPGPAEIVFDNRYLWVSHHWIDKGEEQETHYLSQIDPLECQVLKTFKIELPLNVKEPAPVLKNMVFDGAFIWAVYDAEDGNGLIRIDISDTSVDVLPTMAVNSEGSEPVDLTFDGTHIWVTHEKGVSKFDIQTGEDYWTVNQRRLTAVAFDGQYVWAAKPNDGKLYKVDIFSEEYDAYERIMTDVESYEVEKICFDGSHIWVAGSQVIDADEYRSESRQSVRKGLIHRFLP